MRKFLKIIFILLAIFLVVWFWPARPIKPEYGATFSAKYARELDLDPQIVYEEMLKDLGLRQVRLVAYWDEIEKDRDRYDWTDLDWQIAMSEKYNVSIILSVGRRVPRWPECHLPTWLNDENSPLTYAEKSEELKEFLRDAVTRYKIHDSITYWQIENEAFFSIFASEICGHETDVSLIDSELALVQELDPNRPILMTDSGNVGTWGEAYQRGDAFGSTFYVYLMFDGKLRSPLTHNAYKIKRAIMSSLYGEKETMLVEVSVEPWLTAPISTYSEQELLKRLSTERVQNILKFAARTGFEKQYLWGLEWHYYMKQSGHPEYWDLMREVFENK